MPRVYQANAAVKPTFTTTYTSHMMKIHAKDLAVVSCFGAAVVKPIASRIMFQNENMSSEPSSAASHFGASLERKAPALDATMFCKSIVPGSFNETMTIALKITSTTSQ